MFPGKQGDSATKHERPTVTFAPTSPKKTDNFDSFGRPRTAAEDVRYATIASLYSLWISVTER